jgi:hypothetical protein
MQHDACQLVAKRAARSHEKNSSTEREFDAVE